MPNHPGLAAHPHECAETSALGSLHTEGVGAAFEHLDLALGQVEPFRQPRGDSGKRLALSSLGVAAHRRRHRV